MVSIAYWQDQSEFVADRVAPNVPVQKQSDRYYVYNKENWFRPKAKRRGPSAESAGSGYTLDNTPTYFADVWAIHHDIDDDIRANADAVLDPDLEATEFVTRDLILTKEVQWASTFFTTSIWTGSSTGSDVTPSILWSAAGSTPIADIRTQLRSVKAKNGFRANKIVMNDVVWDALQDNADFLERIKYTQTAIVTTGLLAAVLGLDEVLVGGAVINTVNEGQTDSLGFLFGNHCLCVYVPPRAGLRTPSAMYTFSWTARVGGFLRVLRFRLDWLKCDRVEGEMAFALKQIAPTLGALLASVA